MTKFAVMAIPATICLCEIEDLADFSKVVSRKAFIDYNSARLWADSFIANRRLEAIRKYGAEFREAYFGLEARFRDIDFDPPREPSHPISHPHPTAESESD